MLFLNLLIEIAFDGQSLVKADGWLLTLQDYVYFLRLALISPWLNFIFQIQKKI